MVSEEGGISANVELEEILSGTIPDQGGKALEQRWLSHVSADPLRSWVPIL